MLGILLILLLPGAVKRHAHRIFPIADRPVLILTFAWAAIGFGALLWLSGNAFIDIVVGWFLVAGLSLVGYLFARLIV